MTRSDSRDSAIGIAIFTVIATVMAWFAGADFSLLTERTGHDLATAGLLLGAYFLPAIVAYRRHHHSAPAILLLDLLLGWTGIGWVLALIWSMTGVRR